MVQIYPCDDHLFSPGPLEIQTRLILARWTSWLRAHRSYILYHYNIYVPDLLERARIGLKAGVTLLCSRVLLMQGPWK